MANKLEVSVIDRDGTVKVIHNFYGATEEEADSYFQAHMADDKYLSNADEQDRVVALMEEIADDELPTAEQKRQEEAEGEEPEPEEGEEITEPDEIDTEEPEEER